LAKTIQGISPGQIATQEIGDETLVYDERRHMAFCLNSSISAVWRLADGERTVATIALEASRELGVEIGEELVTFALGELRENGLLEAATRYQPEAEGEGSPSQVETSSRTVADRMLSRRSMLARLSAAALLPVVTSILAPTAAQAYSGCVDCSSSQAAQVAKARRQQQLSGTKR
jgi:hypothetical protein